MATKKNPRVIKFVLTDDDYLAFGRYRILYTAGGRKLVNRQRLTYLISGLAIAGLFTLFHADHQFTMIAYAVAAVIGIGGPIMAERILLRQQDKAIKNSYDTIERVHAVENVVTIGDDALTTDAGDDHQSFDYKDLQLVDLTEEAIYVWMSETMIMPIPLHAFAGMPEMKEAYQLIRQKIKEAGGTLSDDSK
ncbi:MAG: hypothetical protein IJJ06_05135 [Mogibacterium sp.]|nr:hypothetical protein [Mogibacterium sp.]